MERQNNYTFSKWATYICMALFAISSIVFSVLRGVEGRMDLALRGLFIPLLLLIPLLFRALRLAHCYRLYTITYAFLIFAYSYGSVYGGFKDAEIADKVSHFLSGFLFTILGFCIYYWQAGPQPDGLRHKPWLSAGYALFFSSFIALAWEVCEYFDFALTGNDSQHHLTTGVFDTMHDLMSCLLASLISAGAFLLYRYTKIRLLTASVVEEFYNKNIAVHEIKEEETHD